MNKKSTTKDELFLLKLHEIAHQNGDPQHAVCRFAIGRLIGQNDRGANIIARDLCAANFVKKGGETEVYLTDHGLSLVTCLLEER